MSLWIKHISLYIIWKTWDQSQWTRIASLNEKVSRQSIYIYSTERENRRKNNKRMFLWKTSHQFDYSHADKIFANIYTVVHLHRYFIWMVCSNFEQYNLNIKAGKQTETLSHTNTCTHTQIFSRPIGTWQNRPVKNFRTTTADKSGFICSLIPSTN